MDELTVDIWAANLQHQVPSLDAWLALVEERVAVAAGRGAHILMMPEFCCAQWLNFAPQDLPDGAQLGWLAEVSVPALSGLRGLAMQYGVAIMPGTMPARGTAEDGSAGYYNRAWFLTPEGNVHFQDKLSLTPLESDAAAGTTLPGHRINVFVWRGLRMAMPVCLDTEYTALWSLLGAADLDLVLIAAKTDMITGYSRVFSCARARAIELQTVVCVAGAVGAPLTPWQLDSGIGGAAVYVPCDVTVSDSGVWAALEPQSAQEGLDIALHAPVVPMALVRAVRQGSAEAELRPASWSAEHLAVVETAPDAQAQAEALDQPVKPGSLPRTQVATAV